MALLGSRIEPKHKTARRQQATNTEVRRGNKNRLDSWQWEIREDRACFPSPSDSLLCRARTAKLLLTRSIAPPMLAANRALEESPLAPIPGAKGRYKEAGESMRKHKAVTSIPPVGGNSWRPPPPLWATGTRAED
ncbi:hypothetical protein NDU88_002100 [Pleurodeles waltl]|uniref:Uncharacterized protein n=1 Tax=Pleurodeles waltl TaxID=8319 RepID=A0AAV7M2D5_PLEWA|nr:hypothetical protein NDU88_002100 [Pleurodeles waltl]